MARHVDDLPRRGCLAEDDIQRLQVAVHGFGEEEVHRDGDAGRDDGEDDVVLIADGLERDGGDHDNDKVPQPVVARRDGAHGHTQPHGRHLGAVQEVAAQEADRVEGVEEEDEDGRDDGRDARLAEAVGDGQHHHAHAHARARDDEHLAPAQPVDDGERDERAEELPRHGARRQDPRQIRRHVQVLLKDGAHVRRDEVASAHLLEELQRDAQAEPVPEPLLVRLAGLEDIHQPGRVGRDLETGLNAGDLDARVLVVGRDALVGGKGDRGLFDAADADEPPGGLGQPEDGADEDDGEGHGDGQRDAPGQGSGDLAAAEVDPVAEGVSETDADAVDDDMLAAVLGRRALRLPDRHRHRELTDTNTEDHTSDRELLDAVGGGLEELADDGEDGAEEDGLAAAEPVAHRGAGEGAHERPELEGGDDGTLAGAVGGFLAALGVDGIDLGEDLDPTRQGGQGTQAGLIVTIEDEGRGYDEQSLRHAQGLSVQQHRHGREGGKGYAGREERGEGRKRREKSHENGGGKFFIYPQELRKPSEPGDPARLASWWDSKKSTKPTKWTGIESDN